MNKLFAVSLLTISVIASFIFFLIILILLYLDTVNLPVAIFLTIVVNIALWLAGPTITDAILSWLHKARFFGQETVEKEFPDVYAKILDISVQYHFPFPKIGIIPDKNPTAFTYGTGRFNARIVLTEGIFHYLNPNEIKAVVAHELGHIVNRDFVVMMVASTLIQVLYEIYSVLIRARGRKSGGAKSIALIAYVFYIISLYLVLFLSRTREYLADEFSAKSTSPQDLANALIKIAYGIVAAEDTDSTKRLLQSTRHLGITDVKNAKYIGVASYITHQNPEAIAEVMAFDKVSPWAKLIELQSTHPLTGNRLDSLASISRNTSQSFAYDIQGAIGRLKIDSSLIYERFTLGVLLYFTPIVFPLILLVFLPFSWFPLGVILGVLMLTIYRFYSGKAQQTSIFDEMRNPYASPLRGKPVIFSGKVVGRGVPGYIFSEDMLFQDETGLTFVDYSAFTGFIGDIFFALSKIKKLMNTPATIEGWFFRGMSSTVALKTLKTDTEKVRSHPVMWYFLSKTLYMTLVIYLLVRVLPLYISGFLYSYRQDRLKSILESIPSESINNPPYKLSPTPITTRQILPPITNPFSNISYVSPFNCDYATIAMWRMEEDNDSLVDECSTYKHGRIFGTSRVSGIFGWARQFNGNGDYVDFGPAVPASQIRTIEAWVKFDELSDGQEIISKSAYSRGVELLLWDRGLKFYVMGGGNDKNIGIPYSYLNTSEFFYVAATHDGPGSIMLLYLNGKLMEEGIAPDVIEDAPSLFLGKWTNEGDERYFRGVLDEVRLSSVARSADEIRRTYENVLKSKLQNRSQFEDLEYAGQN